MLSLPALLRRLRRAWAPPGPALARVAPPTDVAARLREEIRLLLEVIAEMQRAAEVLRQEADRKGEELVNAASREAQSRIQQAQNAAPATRAAAVKGKREEMEVELDRLMAASRSEVARIEAMVEERLPALVEEVRSCVLAGAGMEEPV